MIENLEIKRFKGLEHITLSDIGAINVLVGKNNSGKSSILHAIDLAGLALTLGEWSRFQPKHDIKDLFWEAGDFSITLKYQQGDEFTILSADSSSPQITPNRPAETDGYRTILIQPEIGEGSGNRRHKTPQNILQLLERRSFQEVSSLDILFAIKFYAERNERDLTIKDYDDLITEVKEHFPDLDDIISSRTETDIATLRYKEYGKELDILYSGAGLRHFLDILIKIYISRAKIVLIDEPEMGLHPDLQRKFMDYLVTLTETKHLQFFISTHSPIILNYLENMTYYRITNIKDRRSVERINTDTVHTLLGDLGLRPSDIFNSDICLLVEGPTDVIFFEHIISSLFEKQALF